MTKAVDMSVLQQDARRDAFAGASHFRDVFYACLTARRDALFELTDALLCTDGAVTTPVDLTLTAEHRRGHGAMYDALNAETSTPRGSDACWRRCRSRRRPTTVSSWRWT